MCRDKGHPDLLVPHGGYRNLKSYRNAERLYRARWARREARR